MRERERERKNIEKILYLDGFKYISILELFFLRKKKNDRRKEIYETK